MSELQYDLQELQREQQALGSLQQNALQNAKSPLGALAAVIVAFANAKKAKSVADQRKALFKENETKSKEALQQFTAALGLSDPPKPKQGPRPMLEGPQPQINTQAPATMPQLPPQQFGDFGKLENKPTQQALMAQALSNPNLPDNMRMMMLQHMMKAQQPKMPLSGIAKQMADAERMGIPIDPATRKRLMMQAMERAGKGQDITINNQPGMSKLQPGYERIRRPDNTIVDRPIIGSEKDPRNVQKYRERIQAIDTFDQLLQTYKKELAKNSKGKIIPSGAKTRLQTAYTELLLEYKELKNLGVLNGPDVDIIKAAIPDPTTVLNNIAAGVGGKDVLSGGLNMLDNTVKRNRALAKKIYGVDKVEARDSISKTVSNPADKKILIKGDKSIKVRGTNEWGNARYRQLRSEGKSHVESKNQVMQEMRESLNGN